MKAMLDLLVMTVKFAVLSIVFFRFHASWIGLCVVSGMAILLFRLDRSLVRWASGAIGARR